MYQIEDIKNKILCGDALIELKKIPDDCIDMICTSPPYFSLRDYNVAGQIGLEPSLAEYLDKLFTITAELKRILKPIGTFWWIHGDSYGTGSGAGIRKGSKQGTVRGSNEWYEQKGKAPIIGYEKSLLMQNYRLTMRMVDEQGWRLRNIIIWEKPNAIPSSVKDRFSVNWEPVFFFTKSKRYYFEPQYEPYADVLELRYRQALRAERSYNQKEPYKQNSPYCHKNMNIPGQTPQGMHKVRMEKYKRGEGSNASCGDDRNRLVVGGINPLGRNKRCVWRIPTHPFSGQHFATFPPALIEPMVKAGCPPDGIVLDPFMGSGTTAIVAQKLGRLWVGIELKPEYIKIAEERLKRECPQKLFL